VIDVENDMAMVVYGVAAVVYTYDCYDHDTIRVCVL